MHLQQTNKQTNKQTKKKQKHRKLDLNKLIGVIMIQMHIRMIRCHTHHDWLRFDQSEASRLEVKALNNHLSQAQELIRTIPIMLQTK